MKLIKGELSDKVLKGVRIKVRKHPPYALPVRKQIEKNFGLWWNGDDDLLRLKIYDPKLNIRNDLDETD